MKDEILVLLTMKDILGKYGIRQRGTMFNCPFHGQDKHPSAKAYKNSFHCFTCQKNGDLIQFVQYYFNLSFIEAMEKLNQDFNLGLDSNVKIDYKKIDEIKKKRKQEQIKKQNELKKYLYLSDKYREIRNKIFGLQNEINILNWEDKEYQKSQLQDKLDLLEINLERLEQTF